MSKRPHLNWNGPLYWYDGGTPATDEDAEVARRVLEAVRGGPQDGGHLRAACSLGSESHVVHVIWRMVDSGLVRFESDWQVARVYQPFQFLRDAGYDTPTERAIREKENAL